MHKHLICFCGSTILTSLFALPVDAIALNRLSLDDTQLLPDNMQQIELINQTKSFNYKQQNDAEELYQEGLRQFRQDNLDEAILYMEQARTRFNEIGDQHREGDSLVFIGLLKTILEDYYNAVKYLHEALAIARDIGYVQLEETANEGLRIAHRDLRQYNADLCMREDEIVAEIEQGIIGDRFIVPSVLPSQGGSESSITFGLGDAGSSVRLIAIPSCQGDSISYSINPQGDRRVLLNNWASGSVVRFSGNFEIDAFLTDEINLTVRGDISNPLVFSLIENVGMVYLYGSGSLILEDGSVVVLP
jgi:hypothetical protein